MEEMRAVFLKINGHAKSRKQIQKANIDSSSEYMSERLIWLKDVEFVRTSLKRDNYVDYILKKKVEKGNLEYLSEMNTLKKLKTRLPNYFLQINRSMIVNMFYIEGRSSTHIFTQNRNFKIGKTYRKEVFQEMDSFLLAKKQQLSCE